MQCVGMFILIQKDIYLNMLHKCADEYANNKRLYSKPGQTLMIFNNEYGRESTYHIPL